MILTIEQSNSNNHRWSSTLDLHAIVPLWPWPATGFLSQLTSECCITIHGSQSSQLPCKTNFIFYKIKWEPQEHHKIQCRKQQIEIRQNKDLKTLVAETAPQFATQHTYWTVADFLVLLLSIFLTQRILILRIVEWIPYAWHENGYSNVKCKQFSHLFT